MTVKKPSDNITASNYKPANAFIRSIGLSQWRVTNYLEIAANLQPQGLTVTDYNIAQAVNPKWNKSNGKIAMAPLVKAGLFKVLPFETVLGQQYTFTPKGEKALVDLKALKDKYDAKVEAKAKLPKKTVKVAVTNPLPLTVEDTKPAPVMVEQVTDDSQELRKMVEQLVSTVEKQAVSMDAMATELFRLGKLWSE